jgi:hypothetical protein
MLNGISEHVQIMLESVRDKTKHISEVLVAKIDEDLPYAEEELKPGCVVKRFGTNLHNLTHGHALGLHLCIESATKKYVMLCDPDIFFYTAVDEFYLDLIVRHELNIVGICSHNATGQCFSFFPYPMNLMMRRDTLPSPDWMKGRLFFRYNITKHPKVEDGLAEEALLTPAPGKYLLQGPIPEFQESYPNKDPNCLFDIGCNLWLWNEERKGKWISFQTLDTHIYTTGFYKSNFKFKEKLGNRKLLYHQTNSVLAADEGLKLFRQAYEASKS